MMHMPVLDDNGMEVPYSWSEARDSGALSFFAAADEACPTCGCRRYITATLTCWGCAQPPRMRLFSDVAPSLEVAKQGSFHFFKPSTPCAEHPSSDFHTDVERCVACVRAEQEAEFVERTRLREEKQKQELAEYRALVREENRLHRDLRKEQEKLEASAQIITKTVGQAKRKTLARAVKMEKALN